MLRSTTRLVMLAIIAGLLSGCIPRHPPHTPQPVGEEEKAPPPAVR
jgi:hypothetical protein